MNEQLDMFTAAEAAKPATAKIVVFPLARRCKTVRTVASTLTKRVTDEGKVAYWNRTLNGLRRELEHRGCSAVAVAQQVQMFREAVSLELARQQCQDDREQA